MKPIAIVGGGLTGLVAAYRLRQKGLPVVLFEAATRTGGMVRSERRAGCLLELGPNSSLSKAEFLALCNELGLADQIVEPQDFAKNRYLVQADGNLEPIPRKLTAMPGFGGLSTAGKLRALGELFYARRPASEDQSVREFVSEHFGAEVADRLVAPMLGGIWAADISKLSCKTALPALWQLSLRHRSIVGGSLRRYLGKGSKHNKGRPHIISLANGMQQLTDALAAKIGREHIRLRSRVEQIKQTPAGCTLSISGPEGAVELAASSAVICLPARETASLIAAEAPLLATRLQDIPYAPLGLLHLRCPRTAIEHPLDGFGCLVAPCYGFATLGILFSSSLFAGRAAGDDCLLTVFCGGAGRQELARVDTETIRKKVIAEVQRFLGIHGIPELLYAGFIPRAIPNYPLGHQETQQAVEEFNQSHPALQLLGNWASGISLNCRIAQAEATIERLLPLQAEETQLETPPLRRVGSAP